MPAKRHQRDPERAAANTHNARQRAHAACNANFGQARWQMRAECPVRASEDELQRDENQDGAENGLHAFARQIACNGRTKD